MQPLIHKAALATLELNPHALRVAPGDPIILQCDVDETVTAYVSLPSRLPFGLGKRRQKRLGTLEPYASELLIPALTRQAHLRVRVVEVEYAHLSTRGKASVSISVWGNPMDLTPTPRKYTIFSHSRINAPMPHPNDGHSQDKDG